MFPVGWSRDEARETKKADRRKDLSLAQDVSSKQGVRAMKKASQGGGSTLGSSKKQESHTPPPLTPFPHVSHKRRRRQGGSFTTELSMIGRQGEGDSGGVGDCACFSVWAGLGTIAFFFLPLKSTGTSLPPLPSLSAGLRQRPEPAPARPDSARGGAGVIRGAGDAG